MLVQLNGSAVFSVDAHLITIEVNVDRGIGYHLVGLPDNATLFFSGPLLDRIDLHIS